MSLGDDPPPPPPNRSWFGRSFIARHWRGELSLPRSYWINGALATVVFVGVDAALGNLVTKNDSFDPEIGLSALVAVLLSGVLITVWQFVGIWRSASAHPRRGGSRFWAVLAKIAVVLGVLRTIGAFQTQAVPQISELVDIVRGDPAFAQHKIRVLRRGAEVEYAGGITFGAADELRAVLDANPGIKVLHLNSIGGRILEARRMMKLVRERGLVTTTGTRCMSACTLVFLGGRERYLAPGAQLGFHQESSPGISGTQLAGFEQTDRAFMRSLGIPQDFIDRAFTTASTDMWLPSPAELKAANIIMGVSSVFAITGFDDKDLPAEVDKLLATASAFAVIKEVEPAAFDKLRTNLVEAARNGASQNEIVLLIVARMTPLFQKYLPHASDAVAVEFVRTFEAMLVAAGKRSADECYFMLFPDKAPGTFSLANALSAAEQTRMLDIETRAIRDGVARNATIPSPDEMAAPLGDVLRQLQAKDGDRVALLSQLESPTMDHRVACQLATDLYGIVLSLPEAQQGPLLRFMFNAQ